MEELKCILHGPSSVVRLHEHNTAPLYIIHSQISLHEHNTAPLYIIHSQISSAVSAAAGGFEFPLETVKQCLHLHYTEQLREGLVLAVVFNWWQRHEHDTPLTLHTGNILWVIITSLCLLCRKKMSPHITCAASLHSNLNTVQPKNSTGKLLLTGFLSPAEMVISLFSWRKMSKYLKSTWGLLKKMAPAAPADIPMSLQLWQCPKDP